MKSNNFGYLLKEGVAGEKQAEALGMLVRADVTLTEEEYPQPWSATLTGTLDPEQVRALSEFLSQSLGIPTERQTWKTYG